MLEISPEHHIITKILLRRSITSIQSINLGLLFDLFRRHKLLPLLQKDFLALFDEKTRKSWNDAKMEFSIKSLSLTGALDQIINHLSKEEINVIAIKGPVLAQRLYGDIGKRHFGDLDLVVHREDVFKVIGSLQEMGYVMISPRADLTQKQWEFYFRYKKDVGLVNREKGVFVELHMGVFRHELLRRSDESLMWEDLTEEMIGNTPVKCMNRENTFLYLLFHGAQHLYFRLFWLQDIAEALKKWELDHNQILNNSKTLGIDRLVGLGLLLAKDFFDSNIPQEYDQYLSENSSILNRLVRICTQRIYGPEYENFFWKVRRHRYFFLLKPGLKYKWAVFASIFHRWYIRKFLGGH